MFAPPSAMEEIHHPSNLHSLSGCFPLRSATPEIGQPYRCAGAQCVRTYSSTASCHGRGVSPVTAASFRVLMAV